MWSLLWRRDLFPNAAEQYPLVLRAFAEGNTDEEAAALAELPVWLVSVIRDVYDARLLPWQPTHNDMCHHLWSWALLYGLHAEREFYAPHNGYGNRLDLYIVDAPLVIEVKTRFEGTRAVTAAISQARRYQKAVGGAPAIVTSRVVPPDASVDGVEVLDLEATRARLQTLSAFEVAA